MARQQSSGGIIAGAITVLGLGLVWATVVFNFPSQEELSSSALPAETRHAARPVPTLPEAPTLDFNHSDISSAAFRDSHTEAGR